ncbi:MULTISPECIES: RHS repeat domain-containing protein, partial [unclassified Tenacibaculum]|uniref:RHS repeat domain-containing protein n=1 Tax=unclassified Tenacibaculum TaxID=2635139 RepID=UPI0027294ECA
IIQGKLNDLGYQYKYDHRNRLVEKRMPGKDWEYIVYDKLDRPVLTQDANLRQNLDWLFTKYDALGRVVYTGKFHSGSTRPVMQSLFEDDLPLNMYEDVSTSTITIEGTSLKYTNRSYPTDVNNLQVYTINYYDTYADLPVGLTSTATTSYGKTTTTNTKGLATISKVRVLGTNNWITTVTYYDEKARPIYVYSKNDELQTTDIVESKLDDFTGRVLETKATHKKTGKADVVTVDSFEYDYLDRLISQTQKINNQVSNRIVKNNYDELGQLTSKIVGNGVVKGYKDVTSGITINDDLITETGGASWTNWTEGLATQGSFIGNGYVEFETVDDNKNYMVGLSDNNTNSHYGTIDYAIYIRGSYVDVYESRLDKGNKTTNTVGDVFRVERIGSQVYYKKNGKTFYISGTPSTGVLLGDISIGTGGSKIKDLKIVENNKGLQTVDYKYNVRGWLKNINQDTNTNDGDLFNFTLAYNKPTSGGALFNGNISQTSWNTLNTDTSSKTYTYSYDALNRILGATGVNGSNYNVSGITYDKNGNILSLIRNGHTNVGATSFGVMDNLVYSYDNGNKLTKVLDNGNDIYGFKDGANTTTEYTYDVNGNMKTDANKGITNIVYNHLNLPTQVTIGGQNITYTYDAAGMKLKKVVNGTTTEYAGNYMYENNVLQFFSHPEGYVKVENVTSSTSSGSAQAQVEMSYVYQYKDHLGNVRLSYTDSNNDGVITPSTEIVEESNYYPFGLKHKGYNGNVSSLGNSVAQKFGFIGKEFNEELGLKWYDISARNYDPSLGKWFNIDPLAEDMYEWSPYNYSFNSPIVYLDDDGNSPISIFVKIAAKQGIKLAGKNFIKKVLKRKLKQYGSKAWGKQLLKDASNFVDHSMKTQWWEWAVEVIPVVGDAYGASKLGKQGYRLWKGLEKFEKVAEIGAIASSRAWKKLGSNHKLIGKGKNKLQWYIQKINKQGTHLNPDDLGGAVKEIFGLSSNGQHLKEVTGALGGMGKRIRALKAQIKHGDFSGDTLKLAKKILSETQKQYNEIQNALNSARKAVKKLQ